tara:strand:+ start:672 stop:1181 length:510 start_codon:yes stop_codon:yes gene_type:complete
MIVNQRFFINSTMAITITDKALENLTDNYQDSVNKYLLLYTRKLVFDEGVTILGSGNGTVIPLLAGDILNVGNKQAVYNVEGDDTSGIKHYLVLNNEGNKDFFYYFEESGVRKGRSVSFVGQTSASDNQQQIGSLDLHITWSNDENSFIGNSTIDYDEVIDRLTIDVTP